MLLIAFAYSFTLQKEDSSIDSIKGNVTDDYPSVVIGSQEWMTENLNEDRFRNGETIPEVKSSSEWKKARDEKKPAWCYYDNDPANGNIYGKLYNWYAVNDPRGLAPEGWHVPSDKEWTVLTTYLGGKEINDETEGGVTFWSTPSAGGKMKSTGTQYWNSPNEEATNSSGFSGLPGGGSGSDGVFGGVGNFGGWWSSSEYSTNFAWARYLYSNGGRVVRGVTNEKDGLSVRCLRD